MPVTKQEETSAPAPPKTIVLCFDGTSNEYGSENTSEPLVCSEQRTSAKQRAQTSSSSSGFSRKKIRESKSVITRFVEINLRFARGMEN